MVKRYFGRRRGLLCAGLLCPLLWSGSDPGLAAQARPRSRADSLRALVNYDEAKVPAYTLPELLVPSNGDDATLRRIWWQKRRPEILRLYEEHVYGKSPRRPEDMWFETRSVAENALGGKATRKQVRIRFGRDPRAPYMDLLLYVPKGQPKPVPVLLGPNFQGNHTIHTDPGIDITRHWVGNLTNLGMAENRAVEAARGNQAYRWQVERVLDRGYAMATFYYGDLEPDHPQGYREGVRGFFLKPGQTAPGPGEWGAIGAWAWGMSRAMDYLQTDPDINSRRVILHGHSRIGKAALWAGAQDQRFAMVISNDSGEGGASLARRNFGETVEILNLNFPHWFAPNFSRYNGKPNELPVDQHMLLALVAPRPLLVASAAEDVWADPRGEFLAAKHASAVYRLLGAEGVAVEEMPAPDQPALQGTVGYYLRMGQHDVLPYDWERWMDFADRHVNPVRRSPAGS